MLNCRKTGWAVAWGKRHFVHAHVENSHVFPYSPPIFQRKQDAQFFLDLTLESYKRTGWFREKDADKMKLVRVKFSVDLV
jgi:hypothetical protein